MQITTTKNNHSIILRTSEDKKIQHLKVFKTLKGSSGLTDLLNMQ